jgi:cell division protein FtsB
MSGISPSAAPRRHDTRRVSRANRTFVAAMVILAVTVMGNSLFGERGLLALARKREAYEKQLADVERQRAENARLAAQVRRLTEDPAAIEELARRDLGLVRPGEKLIIIRDVPSPQDKH